MSYQDIRQKEDLHKQVGRLESEARMVLPGIQALFGFQLIAVFNHGFEKLGFIHHSVHFVAILSTIFSTLFIMVPAAYHRQVEQGVASVRFVSLASRAMRLSMFFLALSISLDLFVISEIILKSRTISFASSLLCFMLFLFSWFIYPQVGRIKWNIENS